MAMGFRLLILGMREDADSRRDGGPGDTHRRPGRAADRSGEAFRRRNTFRTPWVLAHARGRDVGIFATRAPADGPVPGAAEFLSVGM